jgi:signal transduction histidine kinase
MNEGVMTASRVPTAPPRVRQWLAALILGGHTRRQESQLQAQAEQLDTQAAEITRQAAEISALAAEHAHYSEREQRLLTDCARLRDSARDLREQADGAQQAAEAVQRAIRYTMTERIPAALSGTPVPPVEAGRIDAEIAKLLDQAVSEAGSVGDRQDSMRSAVVALARRVQASAHRIQEEATLMAERHPGDADVLEVSMRVDHAAAQQARHAQSMAVLCGEWPGRQWPEPLPLVDVVRAAAGRIIAYRRIEVAGDQDIAAAAPIVEPMIHLVAELLANATQSSPPTTQVPVTVRAVQRGAVIEVHDCGVGLDDYRLTRAREAASGTHVVGLDDLGEFPQTGLAVVGQYVRRHGFRVDISESVYGGVRAVVGIPSDLVETVDPAEAVPARGSTTPAPAPAPATPATPAADEARRGLPRRHSPRHQGAAGVSPAASAQPIAATPPPAPAPAPATQPSPEEAGAWMGAFLTATDNPAQQREQ